MPADPMHLPRDFPITPPAPMRPCINCQNGEDPCLCPHDQEDQP